MSKIRRASYEWGIVYVSETQGADGLYPILGELLYGGRVKLRSSDPRIVQAISDDAAEVENLERAGSSVPNLVVRVAQDS